MDNDRSKAIEALAFRLTALAPGESATISIEALEWALGAPIDETLPRFANPEAFGIVIDEAAGKATITAL